MIFNIEEISEKIREKKRQARPKTHPKRASRSLVITQKALPEALPDETAPKIFEIAKAGQEKRKAAAKIIVSNYHLDKPASKILLALLYWSSGSKYPSSNFVAFSNHDQNLVKTFLNLLRKTFSIDESKIKVHLQLRADQNRKEMVSFWSSLLQVSADQFYKPTITKAQLKKKSANHYGTCTVRYYSLELLLKIMEIYEGLANVI